MILFLMLNLNGAESLLNIFSNYFPINLPYLGINR